MWPKTTQELTKVFVRALQRTVGDPALAQGPSKLANCRVPLPHGNRTRTDASSALGRAKKEEAPKRLPVKVRTVTAPGRSPSPIGQS